jgi:hypothetical protein
LEVCAGGDVEAAHVVATMVTSSQSLFIHQNHSLADSRQRNRTETYPKISLTLNQSLYFSNWNLFPNSVAKEGRRDPVGMIKVPGIKPTSLGICSIFFICSFFMTSNDFCEGCFMPVWCGAKDLDLRTPAEERGEVVKRRVCCVRRHGWGRGVRREVSGAAGVWVVALLWMVCCV